MNYKNNLKNLIKLREDLLKYENKEKKDTSEILSWRKKLLKKSKIKAKLINISQCKDWYFDKNKNLHHKSGQFFKVTGVKVIGAKNREVVSWTQPILDQKHGGVLAFICRVTKENGVHGGKLPRYYDIVIELKGAKLIYSAAHNEEGARFWKKSNLNVIVKLNNPYDKRIYGQNYKWVSLSQLKELSLKNNILNPFVKTILFMI